MKHIGIVACSAEGASLCYRTICAEGAQIFGPYGHPEISMHSHPLARYVECIERDDWQGVAELMLASSEKLAKTGAAFLICPDNTIHNGLRYVEERSPLPWLNIADVVADEAVSCGFRRIGVLGTRWLTQSDIYPEKLAARGIECLRPQTDEAKEMNRIIMDELVYGVFKPETVIFFRGVINRMREEHCDAVAMACTEIPLVLNDLNSPLPTLDSTRLLARAALRKATEERLGNAIG